MLQIQWFHRSVEESYIFHSFKEGNHSLTLPLSCPYLCWGHFWWDHFWWRMDPIGRFNPIRTYLYMSVSSASLSIEVPAPIQESDWSSICYVIGHLYVMWLVMYMFCDWSCICFVIGHDCICYVIGHVYVLWLVMYMLCDWSCICFASFYNFRLDFRTVPAVFWFFN